MFCAKCGAKVDESQGFCKSCGARLASSAELSQSKPKFSRSARLAFWGLGILTGVVALHVLMSSPEQDVKQGVEPALNTRRDIPPPQTAEKQQKQEPSFSVVYGDTTFHGASSSNVGVAILRITSGPYLLGSELIRADGKFISVTVSISNGQNSAVVMDTGLFEILDSKGNVYSASEKSMEVDSAHNLFFAQLNPGITRSGEILFDVPQSLGVDNLLLRFRGGMTGETAILPLKVDSTTKETAPPSGSPTQPNKSAAPGASY